MARTSKRRAYDGIVGETAIGRKSKLWALGVARAAVGNGIVASFSRTSSATHLTRKAVAVEPISASASSARLILVVQAGRALVAGLVTRQLRNCSRNNFCVPADFVTKSLPEIIKYAFVVSMWCGRS